VVRRQLERVDEVLHRYKRYVHQTAIRDLASRASRIVSLADQFGEGWLIPADISELAERGVHNVLCLQPFGCIANHIVAKGVETRMRELFPQLNMLYLDMDPGAGEANLLNRLHFIVQGARECAESAA
jgi:predicted nucleotide-binding protein (sugar kinase/HSP70/actin superfamily)